MAHLSLAAAHDLAAAVLGRSRTAPDNAATVARALVAAEADGFARPRLEQTAPGVVRVDAADGFAYPAIDAGLGRAAEAVGETGVVAIAIANSHHSGAFGLHVEWLARRGLVGLALANGPAGIAPWGGTRALYGTDPVAFACPRAGAEPLVVDLALSRVARRRIKLHADAGEAIPEGWAVDADGRPTTDAARAMDGALLPIGGAKGAALVLMAEILAAALGGSNFGFEASSFFSPDGPPPRVGQFFLVLDPGRFAGPGFGDRLEVLLDAIVAQPGTRLPGVRRLQARARAARAGVTIADGLHAHLVARAGG